jgi:hypothetical protein
MDFNQFREWAFLTVITGGVGIMWGLKKSVEELNIKIAVIIEKIDTHEKRISRLEENI